MCRMAVGLIVNRFTNSVKELSGVREWEEAGADWREKSGPGVTVTDRPTHSVHGARPTQYTVRGPLSTLCAAHSVHGARPTQCIARIDQSLAYLEKYPFT